jgi:diguanylate cyclase (GGDEF)-like protein
MTEPATPDGALDPALLAEVLRHALDGVAVLDGVAGRPRIVYANATLAGLLHRPEEWPAGRSLDDIEMEAPVDPNRTSVGVGQRVQLRRADGSTVECERWAMLLPDARLALHYRPVPRSAPGALAQALDRSSGLSTPEHLMEVLRRDWSIGQRDGRSLTLMHIDVDACRDYLEVFGRSATENMLRQVGRTIASAMRRTSDVVARLANDEFLLLGVSMPDDRAREHAEHIAGRVRALAIHHPRSRTGRYLTVSAGVVTGVASRSRGCEALLQAAQRALVEAKAQGGNRAVAGTLPEAAEG